MSLGDTVPPSDRSQATADAKLISLVAVAHGFSHFYQLVLPPLFPFLVVSLDTTYAQLGLVLTVFGIASGVAQTPIGFLVDRLGGARVLIIGLAVLSLSVVGFGLATNIGMLMGAALLGGIANATFHPADYAILSAKVHPGRIARAFSFHGVSGNIGWALAPLVMLGLHAQVGLSAAFIVVGLAGLSVAGLLIVKRSTLSAPIRTLTDDNEKDGTDPTDSTADGIALLKSKSVVLCFVFQILHSMASGGIRSFGIVALAGIYGFTADDPNYALLGAGLTAYLVSGSFGNLLSGFLIDRTGRSQTIFTVSILTIFVIVIAIGYFTPTLWVVIGLLVIAGTLQGSLLPARDVLIRAISPPGQIGKVFGFTSSGLSLGNAIMPPLFGWLIDQGNPTWVFYASGGFILCALATFTQTSKHALASPGLEHR